MALRIRSVAAFHCTLLAVESAGYTAPVKQKILIGPDTNSTLASCVALTDKTCDLVAELAEMFKAYLALERFVSPEYEDEGRANVAPSRAELGAMIHVINVAIQRLTGALVDTTTTLQLQLALRR